MEPACNVCVDIVKNKHDIPIQENIILTLDVEAGVINPPIRRLSTLDKTQYKKERDSFIWKLKKYISAIRNTQGGALLVHIKNIAPRDRCLDYLHELIDVRLNSMIEDGSLFVVTYNTDWLSEESEERYRGLVALIVQPSVSVVTLNFHTKVPLDNSIEDPTAVNIYKFLTEKPVFEDKTAQVRGIDKLQENRHSQVKALFKNHKSSILLADEQRLVNYIWDNLKLGQYISAFSKVEGGGSFYVGVEEKSKEYSPYGYTSKQLILTGFSCQSLSQLRIEEEIKSKVETETLLLVKEESQINCSPPRNLIKVAFHPVPNSVDLFVLEVAVAAAEGLLFCDREGAEAYKIDDNDEIKRLDIADWCRRFLSLRLKMVFPLW